MDFTEAVFLTFFVVNHLTFMINKFLKKTKKKQNNPTFGYFEEKHTFLSSQTYCSVHVGWRVAVWVCQHRDNANHDGFYSVDGQPALLWFLVAVLVLTRFVQNRNAYVSVLVNYNKEEKSLISFHFLLRLACQRFQLKQFRHRVFKPGYSASCEHAWGTFQP